MPARSVVIDSCCILNLLATRREVEITKALGLRFLLTPHASEEPLSLWTPPDRDGQRDRHPVSTERLRGEGLLSLRELDSDALVDAFVAAAGKISDTDASCIALAGVLELPLVTDDQKQRRVATGLFSTIDLVTTLDLLHEASRILEWSDSELAEVAADLRWRGNFAPPRRDPRGEWYRALLNRPPEAP